MNDPFTVGIKCAQFYKHLKTYIFDIHIFKNMKQKIIKKNPNTENHILQEAELYFFINNYTQR